MDGRDKPGQDGETAHNGLQESPALAPPPRAAMLPADENAGGLDADAAMAEFRAAMRKVATDQ